MALVYIGVGSNIDPDMHIPAAFEELEAVGIKVRSSSRFYRTLPIGRPDQAPYANGVWLTDCALAPHELRKTLREIEDTLGRVRTEDKFAPRTIDLDILLYGNMIVDDGELLLPDPHILERSFLALCLLEIAPGLRLPGDSVPLRDRFKLGGEKPNEYSEITIIVNKRLENGQ